MHSIDATFSMPWPPYWSTWWRPTRAILLVVAMLLGYAGLLASSMPATYADADDGVSRVELLE